MSDDTDQRAHERVDVGEDYEPIESLVNQYTTNLSRGGVFIRTTQPMAVGTEVNLKIPVYGDDEDDDDLRFIEGLGRVVRADSTPGGEGIGVEFVQLTPESQELVDSLTHEEDEAE